MSVLCSKVGAKPASIEKYMYILTRMARWIHCAQICTGSWWLWRSTCTASPTLRWPLRRRPEPPDTIVFLVRRHFHKLRIAAGKNMQPARGTKFWNASWHSDGRHQNPTYTGDEIFFNEIAFTISTPIVSLVNFRPSSAILVYKFSVLWSRSKSINSLYLPKLCSISPNFWGKKVLGSSMSIEWFICKMAALSYDCDQAVIKSVRIVLRLYSTGRNISCAHTFTYYKCHLMVSLSCYFLDF